MSTLNAWCNMAGAAVHVIGAAAVGSEVVGAGAPSATFSILLQIECDFLKSLFQ